MSSLAFWRAVVEDRSGFLERMLAVLEESGARYCVIGGVAVNAYAAPVVTEDLDIVVAIDDLPRVREIAEAQFRVREFEHSLNVYDPGSKLQVQFQRDPELTEVISRAEVRDVMDLKMPVAAPEDLIDLKVAAVREPTRRRSKRQKDLADVARLTEAFPALDARVPADVRQLLLP